MDKIPILLLAAGNSSRMGSPKQLLPWGKETLIEHQIEKLISTGNQVNVILGSDPDLIIPVIERFRVNIFINSNWENGIGTSIACGIDHISYKFPGAGGALISLLDQPLITSGHFQKIIDVFQSGKRQIVVSKYASGVIGVPVIFDKIYFEEIKRLSGKEGAKKVIQHHMDDLVSVDCDEIPDDMDTPEVYQKLLSRFLENS